MKLFISAIILLIAGQCNTSKKMQAIIPANQNSLSGVKIAYQTSACFGRCPVYTLTIDGSTMQMLYSGTANTDRMGIYQKPVSASELNELVSEFEKADFCQLEDKYLGNVVDFPSKYTSYECNGKTKKIQDRSGAPEKLNQLEKKLQEIAENKDGWVLQADENH